MNLDALRQELTRDEGMRLKPYFDTRGKITIGVGRNLSDVGLTKDEAGALLDADLARTIEGLDRLLPWWRALREGAQRALANMAFNLGLAGLMEFRDMLAALEHGDTATAAAEARASKWARQVGDRAVRVSAAIEGEG